MKQRRILSLFLALLMVFAPLSQVFAADTDLTVERISGNNRYETSIEVNKHIAKAESAIIASGEGFADALGGGQLAGVLNSPLYVTPKDIIPKGLIGELNRLGVKEVYIIGGENSISQEVEIKLGESFAVERLAGENRYETAAKVAHIVRDLRPDGAQYLADGRNFPDALSATPLVHMTQGVLNLVPGDIESNGANFSPTGQKAIAFGGPKSVKAINVERVAGLDRFDTSLQVAKRMGAGETIFVVDGSNYPDALSVAGVAASMNAPILLMPKAGVPEEHMEFIQSNYKNVVIVGGINSVPQLIEDQLLHKEEPKPEVTLYPVTRVVDGDTIVVNINGVEEKVRLIGIDTPESVHPDSTLNSQLGEIASEYTKTLLEGKSVSLELDVQERDKYGRLLAYVYLDGVMVNKTLLTAGMAQVATYPPNVKYVQEFTELESIARENNVGLWGDINIEEPVTTEPIPIIPSDPNPSTGYNGPYHGSVNSDVFHFPDCRSAKRIRSYNLVVFQTRQEASDRGYRPCNVCKP